MIKLFRFLRPYRLAVASVMMLVFFQSLSELYLPTLMADIVNIGIVKGDTPYILKIGGWMLLVAAGGTICTVLASFLSARIATGFSKNLRRNVFARVESYSLHEFDQIGTASLITRTTNDINQIQQVIIMAMRMMISAPMMCIGGIMMAVSKDATLSLILVVIIPVLMGSIYLIVRKGIPLFKVMQEKLDKLNLVLREGLTGIRVIRGFNRVEHEKRRFGAANHDLTDTTIRVNKIMAALMPTMMLILNFTTIGIIWFGGMRIDAGHMHVGDLMAFIQYIMQIMYSLIMVTMMFVMIPRASVSAVRINEVLEIVPEIKDPEENREGITQKGIVEFKNVAFRYAGAEEYALKNITFTAKPGEVTAIIGGTGSSKSTLISLIPRFYDVEQGSILVDGMDIREMGQETLRNKIGFVPQKTILFSGTIADNIRFGKEDASEVEIEAAAETAQALEFIEAMEGGFEAVIAQGGKNISGGQKQRLAIARAFVRKPQIYIFDDSFSALDFKTDAKLRAAMKKEIGEATVIIVAQRVGTVMDADQIIVLEEGEIEGIGKHKELIENCKVYREIVASQLSEEEIA